jgi:BON domain
LAEAKRIQTVARQLLSGYPGEPPSSSLLPPLSPAVVAEGIYMFMHIANSESSLADQDLARSIIHRLRDQHVPDLRRLEVSADKGVITIRGQVSSFHQRQLGIHCCQAVAGVVHINDQINVALLGVPRR